MYDLNSLHIAKCFYDHTLTPNSASIAPRHQITFALSGKDVLLLLVLGDAGCKIWGCPMLGILRKYRPVFHKNTDLRPRNGTA